MIGSQLWKNHQISYGLKSAKIIPKPTKTYIHVDFTFLRTTRGILMMNYSKNLKWTLHFFPPMDRYSLWATLIREQGNIRIVFVKKGRTLFQMTDLNFR